MQDTGLANRIPSRHRLRHDCDQVLDHFLPERVAPRVSQVMFGSSRDSFQERLLSDLSSGTGREHPVPRRTNLSIEELQNEYMRPGRPVVLEGAARDWPACRQWSFDHLSAEHGNDAIDILVNGQHRRLTLARIIDLLRSDMHMYLSFYPLFEQHPERVGDLDYAWLSAVRGSVAFCEHFQVFIGGPGTSTRLHCNIRCNVFIQAHGEKEWILYPHGYGAVLNPPRIARTARYAGVNDFDPFAPVYTARTGSYRFVDSYRTVLRAGDILWNPPYWWHTVRNNAESIGIGFRWIDPRRAFRASPLYASLDVLARVPPVLKMYWLYTQRNTVRATFDQAGGGPLRKLLT